MTQHVHVLGSALLRFSILSRATRVGLLVSCMLLSTRVAAECICQGTDGGPAPDHMINVWDYRAVEGLPNTLETDEIQCAIDCLDGDPDPDWDASNACH